MVGNFDRLQSASDRYPRRISAHEFAREALRQIILTGNLPFGTRLVQTEIANALQVSTTPVRDALRDLQADGLVKVDPRRGTVVVELSDLELVDVFEMRMLLEPLAFQKAIPRMTTRIEDRLEALNFRMQREHLSAEWVGLNREFHRLIYRSSGSMRLFNSITQLQDASVAFVSAVLQRAPEFRNRAVADHQEMISALKAGNFERGAAAIVRHLEIPRDALEQVKHRETLDTLDVSVSDIIRTALEQGQAE